MRSNMKSRTVLFLTAVSGFGFFLLGCSSDPAPTKACTTYQVPAGTDLTKPAVAFRADVIPIFKQSCAFSSCHGGTAGGVTINVNDPAATRKAIVGVASGELTSMQFVAAGDPGNSYLMRKMDGDSCTLKASCSKSADDCAASMPKDSDLLDVSQRDVVRRWIAQGAKDD